jgi:hypothetical protein
MTHSDPDVPPDQVVRAALQLLPIPDHGTDFWADFDAALAAEPAPAAATLKRDTRRTLVADPATAPAPGVPAPRRVLELVPDHSTALVPPALRRTSNLVLSAVAVAAAVMVVVAGTTLVRQRSGDSTDTAEVADSTDDSEAPGASTTSLVALTGAAAEAPTAAVLAWVAALGDGDMTTAWDALGPASQAHFGSKSAFAAEESAMAEGYGAWSATTPDDVLVTPMAMGGADQVVVVTLVGTVAQEGTQQRRADAFPVRIVDGEARVEPFAFAGELEIVVPEPAPAGGTRPVVHSDDELIVVVPRGVEAPTIRLDDGDPLVCGDAEGTELTELDDAPGQRCSYQPEGGIPAGKRVLTVAFLAPDGSGVAAEAVLFEAA